MNFSQLLTDFLKTGKAGGVILLICAIISISLANSSIQSSYLHFWEIEFAGAHLIHWINDGLMTVFFLLIGLELEREVYIGELSNFKIALFPAIAAVGGMLFPACIHLILNHGTPTQSGAGIPMATDIAFALGVLSLLGNRVPLSLKIFLTALAVIDDLGAILTIAIFYSKGISLFNFGMALGTFLILGALNRFKIRNLTIYLLGGVVMWYFMLNSGVHATVSGVLLAFVLPFQNGDSRSTSYRLQHFLHKPVSFVILPIFALANTAITVSGSVAHSLQTRNSIGIILALVIGKPLGIFLFSVLAVTIRVCRKPIDLAWRQIISIGFLGGIGFTMSIFITLLAFENKMLQEESKIAIMTASAVASVTGLCLLIITLPKKAQLRNSDTKKAKT